MTFFKKLSRSFPSLKVELIQAEMKEKPEEIVKKSFVSSLMITVALGFTFLLVLLKINITPLALVLIIPAIFFVTFTFLIKGVKAKSTRVAREIDKDVIYAGRFMLIELNAGVSLFDALRNASAIYGGVGRQLKNIIDKVNIGVPIEQALAETIEITPSVNLRKMLWQIMNSLRTGGDVSDALSAIINQIAKEQIIYIKSYSKKLNALVMFYLMMAIVAPSLGVTILSLISIFMKISLGLTNLLAIAFFVFLIQMMFLSVIRISRPGVVI